MAARIDARTLKRWLADGNELALLDVREAGQFAQGHLFLAVPLPYSRLELDIARLVPNPRVRVVLCDGGDGIAERAARRAQTVGYTGVHILDGGTTAWKAAGYTLYEGVNVPSKAFGELIEIERHTPRIDALELEAMRRRGENFVLVDGRTWAEYTRFNIPGGICCPNGELALRIGALAPDPKTTIVVNCAGRTRSIIGAQTLIDFGVPNRTVALENGTQGWWLAGLQVERGADRRWPDAPHDARTVDTLRERAWQHARRHGVEHVSSGTVAGWLSEKQRTTFLLDVRTAEEFAAGSPPGFVHAPGGQLVQATDQWVGVKGARIVLRDSEQVRAPMTAAWLRQLGHDAFVLGPDGGDIGAPAPGIAPAQALPELPRLGARDLAGLLQAKSARVIDLRASADYRAGHVPGARWSTRPRLSIDAGDPDLPIVLIADGLDLARAAAVDLSEAGHRDVRVLDGGMAAWQAGGGGMEATPDRPADAERIDFVFHTLGRNEGNLDAARAYLAWETNLVHQLDDQERSVFRL